MEDMGLEEEIWRLRKIIDGLNKKIEELRMRVSRSDEFSSVSRKILLDKDIKIQELKAKLLALKSLSPPREKSRQSSLERIPRKTNFFSYSASRAITHQNKKFSSIKKKIQRSSLHKKSPNKRTMTLVDSLLQEYIRDNDM
jgi:hypothetical protein